MQEKLQKQEKKLGWIVLLVMLVALVPLYIIADYAHPSVDDYSYGKLTAEAWEQTGSLGSVLATAWERTAYTYETHQGTFVSVFLMRLQPGIFGEDYYFLTTVFLLSTFLICSILFYYAFFNRIFQAGRIKSWMIAGILSLGAMEFTHVVSDSFYWYNGGVTYTFFYSMEVLLIAMLIYMYTTKKKIVKCLLGFGCMLLAVIACAGNYVTSLVTLELLVCICVVTAFVEYKKIQQKKQKKEQNTETFLRKNGIIEKQKIWIKKQTDALIGETENRNSRWNLIFCLCILLVAAVTFLIVVVAPGNAVRQEKTGEANNPVIAILLSFVYGAYSLGNCMDLPALLLIFFCTPLFVVIARAVCKEGNFAFPYPALVTFFSFCLYSSQVTPVFYAQGIKLPYRIMNIIYFSCFVMVALNLFYWIGYLNAKHTISHVQICKVLNKDGELHVSDKAKKTKIYSCILQTVESWHTKHFWKFYAVVGLLFCFSVAGNISIAAEVDVEGAAQVEVSELPATLSACYFLFNGDAKVFDKECKERYTVYSNPDIKDVVVEPFTVTPDIIFHSDITEDPDNWKNKCIKKYFNKHSVRLAK